MARKTGWIALLLAAGFVAALLLVAIVPALGLWARSHFATSQLEQPDCSVDLGKPQYGWAGDERGRRYLVVFGRLAARGERGAVAESPRSRAILDAFSQRIQARLGKRVALQYHNVAIGFASELSAENIKLICHEAFPLHIPVTIARDREMVLSAFREIQESPAAGVSDQDPPPLALDRIDQRLPAPLGHFSTLQTGKGVDAYVIDSGVYGEHTDFAGSSILHDEVDGVPETDQPGDCIGHGTAVASILAGKVHGVAREATVHSVRVVGCDGTTTAAEVMKAVDWVTEQRKTNPNGPMLVNLSLGSADVITSTGSHHNAFDLLENAIALSISAHITYVIAAGNNGISACNVSPARLPSAITVSSIIPLTDGRPDFANEGKCVDLFASGVGIDAAGIDDPGAEETELEGTSFAAPYVAGVAALAMESLSQAHPGVAPVPDDVWAAINRAATTRAKIPSWCGIANLSGGTPEKLLHWGSGSPDGVEDDPLYSPTNPPCPNPAKRK
jgi:subtilisin family serine protease